jgi:mRNA interferase HigB
MELVNVTALDRFAKKHRDATRWLANWKDIAESARWHNLQDVRRQFPSADGVALKSRVIVTVFNVKGNEYRLLTIINYAAQRIVIWHFLTREEYSREKWK